MRIGAQLLGGLRGLGLHAVAAHAMHALWREAEMTDYWNLRIGKRADEVDARTFDLYCFSAGFLEEADGVGHSLSHGAVIAAEGHIRDQQRTAHGTANGAGMMQHFIYGD